MSEYNSVNDEIRAQSRKLKNMPLHKKIGYYIYYYKWIALAIVFATVLIFFFVRSLLGNRTPAYVTGVFMNSHYTSAIESPLIQEFANYSHVDTDEQKIDFDFSLGYNMEDPTDSLSTYTPPKMIAYSEGKTGDFVLCDADTFDFFAKCGYFADLSQILDKEQLEQYRNRLYYFSAEEGEESIPIAIRIQNTDVLHTSSCYPGVNDICFAIFYNSGNKEHALEFLSFLESR